MDTQKSNNRQPSPPIETIFANRNDAGVLGYGWTPKSDELHNILRRYDTATLSDEDKKAVLEEVKKHIDYIAEMVEHIEYLNGQAWRDAVTGCLNRNAFEREIKEILKPRIAKAMAVAQETDAETLQDSKVDEAAPVTVALLDLNYLKSLNNFSMIDGGDKALKYMADFVSRRLRKADEKIDSFMRYGGDEFAIIMRGCTKEQAEERLAEISNQIAEASVGYDNVINPQTGKKENPCIGHKDGHDIILPVSLAFGCTQLSLKDIAYNSYDENGKETLLKTIERTMAIASDAEAKDKERSKKYAGSGKIEGQFPNCCGTRECAETVIGKFFEQSMAKEKGEAVGKFTMAEKSRAMQGDCNRLGHP
jgi:diguanylate cyclase (GGDEF)-like protein